MGLAILIGDLLEGELQPEYWELFGLPIRENRRYPSPRMHAEAAETLTPVAREMLGAAVDF